MTLTLSNSGHTNDRETGLSRSIEGAEHRCVKLEKVKVKVKERSIQQFIGQINLDESSTFGRNAHT